MTDASVALVANRQVAAGESDVATAYRAAAPTQLATSLLAGVAVLGLGLGLPGPVASHWAVIWTAVFIVFTGLFNGQAELLRGSGQPWIEAGLQMFGALTQVGLGLAVVFAGYGLAPLMAILAVKQLLVMLAAQRWLPSPFGLPDMRLLRMLLRRGLWLGAATTFGAVSTRAAQLVLGNVGSTPQIAHYAVATRYLDVAVTVCSTFSFGLLPAMVQRSQKRTLNEHDFLTRVLRLTFPLALLVVAVAVPLTPWITTSVFGARYRGAGSASQIFVAALPILAMLYLAWFGLVAEKHERKASMASFAGFVVTLMGCALIAIDKSAESAAAVTVAGLGVAALVALIYTRQRSRNRARSA